MDKEFLVQIYEHRKFNLLHHTRIHSHFVYLFYYNLNVLNASKSISELKDAFTSIVAFVFKLDSEMDKTYVIHSLLEHFENYSELAVEYIDKFISLQKKTTSQAFKGLVLNVLSRVIIPSSANTLFRFAIDLINDDKNSFAMAYTRSILLGSLSYDVEILTFDFLSKITPLTQIANPLVMRIKESSKLYEEFLNQFNRLTTIMPIDNIFNFFDILVAVVKTLDLERVSTMLSQLIDSTICDSSETDSKNNCHVSSHSSRSRVERVLMSVSFSLYKLSKKSNANLVDNKVHDHVFMFNNRWLCS